MNSGSWIDVLPLLPSVLSEEDEAELVQAVMKGKTTQAGVFRFPKKIYISSLDLFHIYIFSPKYLKSFEILYNIDFKILNPEVFFPLIKFFPRLKI